MRWSVAVFRDGYATDVQVDFTKREAFAFVLDEGSRWYAIQGTQMWNEPLGQVEEHDRVARVYTYDEIKRVSQRPSNQEQPEQPDIQKELDEVVSIALAWVDDLKLKGHSFGKPWETAINLWGLHSLAQKSKLVRWKNLKPARKVNLVRMQKLLRGIVIQLKAVKHRSEFLYSAEEALYDLKNTTLASRVAFRFMVKLADQVPGQRGRAKKLTQPINKPKSIPRSLQKEMGETVAVGDEVVDPDRKDILPKDVFTPTTKDMGVYNLVETGRDFEEDCVEGNKGYETVNNLSQYLIRTEGGGEGGPEGKKL